MKIFFMLILLPAIAVADMISPSHNCAKPARPSQFATDAERASYDRQVNAFKQCLRDFINEQEKEARLHSEAARNAANELNRIGS